MSTHIRSSIYICTQHIKLNYLHAPGNLSSTDIFQNYFSQKILSGTLIIMSNDLDPYQDRHSGGPNLNQRFSAFVVAVASKVRVELLWNLPIMMVIIA